MLDIFNHSAFTATSLTDAVNEVAWEPGRLGAMKLFETTSVLTLDISIERIGNLLQLVAPSPRGAPGELRDMPKRTIENLRIPHFQRDWHVYADEVQGVRQFGSELALKTVQGVVAERLATQITDFDLTEEYARLGAIKGRVVYKGGSSFDLFSTFVVTEPAAIDFALDEVNPRDGALREKCVGVVRRTRAALGGGRFSNVHALVGDNFFDALLGHREVRDTYKGTSEAGILRETYVGPNRGSNPIFEFAGIVWENYGSVQQGGDAALVGIDTDEARFFPVGAPRLFRTYYAPADYIETVNTLGRRLYAKQWAMPNDKGINGEVQMNALSICTRPATLLKGVRTTAVPEAGQ